MLASAFRLLSAQAGPLPGLRLPKSPAKDAKSEFAPEAFAFSGTKDDVQVLVPPTQRTTSSELQVSPKQYRTLRCQFSHGDLAIVRASSPECAGDAVHGRYLSLGPARHLELSHFLFQIVYLLLGL